MHVPNFGEGSEMVVAWNAGASTAARHSGMAFS
jgi:hypothetical protein